MMNAVLEGAPTGGAGEKVPARTFEVDRLAVKVYRDQKSLAEDAALDVQRFLKDCLKRQNTARAILATGNSQMEFLNALVDLGGVEWPKVTLFHMDEYLGLDAKHPASFRRYMQERVERRLRPRAFNYLVGDAAEPIKECDRYEELLRAEPIDLCCCGIGENGHLAFNDPPVADFHDPRWVKIVELDLASRQQQVGEGHFPGLEAVPRYALTLTLPALCSARKMVCICPETRKASAVKAALEGPISTACPASFLRTQPQATLLLDEDSAALLGTAA
jgi:glucosamine-6-phosphate deaminase